MSTLPAYTLDPNRPTLPEWTRWAWSTMAEREYWSCLIQNVSQAWEELERWAVVDGVRPAAYQTASPERFLELTTWATRHGLVVVPITQINRVASYQSGSGSNGFNPNEPWDYRVIITRPERVALISATPDIAKNDAALGEVLGYPQCCRDFFMRTWAAGQVDTTWDQYATSGSAEGSVEANMLWRWKGIRWVSHLPCSYQCQHTIEIGRQMREMAKRRGFIEEAHTIDTVLSWPTKWSGVNGIAEIVGPCIKVSTRTDWAPPRAGRRFERKGRYTKPTKQMWIQNGFQSFEAMRNAHFPILRAVEEFAPQNVTLLDLGCGNGHLLRRIKVHRPDVQLWGIDINEEAIKEATRIGVGKWEADDLAQLPWNAEPLTPNVVPVYSPVRFTEMSEEVRAKAVESLRVCPIQIVYVYGDNLQKQPLEQWVRDSGFSTDRLLVTHVSPQMDVSVGVLRLQ